MAGVMVARRDWSLGRVSMMFGGWVGVRNICFRGGDVGGWTYSGVTIGDGNPITDVAALTSVSAAFGRRKPLLRRKSEM